MVQFNGWISIETNKKDEDKDDKQYLQNKFIDEIKKEIREYDDICNLKVHNGSHFFTCIGITNHRCSRIYFLIKFFEFVSTHSDASYGVLSLIDDEDETEGLVIQEYLLGDGKLKESTRPLWWDPY